MRSTLFLLCVLLTGFLFAATKPKVYQDPMQVDALANLSCYLFGVIEDIEGRLEKSEKLTYTSEEVKRLWDSAAFEIYAKHTNKNKKSELLFEEAYRDYNEWETNAEVLLLKNAYEKVDILWEDALKEEDKQGFRLARSKQQVSNESFEKNKVIPPKVKKKIQPYVIPDFHPKKAILDQLFSHRVTQNEEIFLKTGFKIISKRPRSYVYVAKHAKLKGYLIKAYMDTELRLKQYTESWEWLVKRCLGAKKIARILKDQKTTRFTVASKWIYPLPDHPLPPSDKQHTTHYAVLIATDMELLPKKENLRKWKTEVTQEDLKLLYLIMTRAKGSSYRADNICFTKHGTLAFIDTEYPSKGPDYYSIRSYLNSDMQLYWEKLIKNGMR